MMKVYTLNDYTLHFFEDKFTNNINCRVDIIIKDIKSKTSLEEFNKRINKIKTIIENNINLSTTDLLIKLIRMEEALRIKSEEDKIHPEEIFPKFSLTINEDTNVQEYICTKIITYDIFKQFLSTIESRNIKIPVAKNNNNE